MMFEEITASSLVKIDLEGRKVMASPYDVNPAAFKGVKRVLQAFHLVGFRPKRSFRKMTSALIRQGSYRPFSNHPALVQCSPRPNDY